MIDFLVAYGVTAAVFLVIDVAWLASMTKRFYRPQLAGLMREKVAPVPSVIFYLLYTAVITMVVVEPAFGIGNPGQALLNGVLVGAAAYATYNLTNAATLKGWPRLLTFVDLVWGTLATGVASWLSTHALLALS